MKALICVASAAVLLSVSTCALAVNYPTELRIVVGTSDVRAPDLLFGFNNNEGDRARFEYEVTIDGVGLGSSGVNDALRCVSHSADPNDCKGAIRSNLREPWTTEKGWRAVVMNPAKFDTEYCFRAITIDDTGRRSRWSEWACAHTPALPARPTAYPVVPQVTLLEQGSSGRGQVVPATPGRMLIEWRPFFKSGDGWYAVERAQAGGSLPAWVQIGRVDPPQSGGGDLEYIEVIKEPANVPGPDNISDYRVCAANLGGKTCSGARSYPPSYSTQKIGQAASPSRSPQRPVVTAQAAPSAAMRIAPPLIIKPTPGSRVVQGRLQLRVELPPGTENAAGEVEFAWPEPRREKSPGPPAAFPPAVVWKTSMAALVEGVLVPSGEGPTQSGMWVARVRVVRGASPDPWSEPVSFTFSLPAFAKTGTTAVEAGVPTQQAGFGEAKKTTQRNEPSPSSTVPSSRSALVRQAAPPTPSLSPTQNASSTFGGSAPKTTLDWSRAASGGLTAQPTQLGRP